MRPEPARAGEAVLSPPEAVRSALEAAMRALEDLDSARRGFDSDLGELRQERDRVRAALESVGREARDVLDHAQRVAASTLETLSNLGRDVRPGEANGSSRGGTVATLQSHLDQEQKTVRSLREEIEDLTHRLRLAEGRNRDLEAQCQAKDKRLREFERALDPR